jgi:hypothetical protein
MGIWYSVNKYTYVGAVVTCVGYGVLVLAHDRLEE